MIKNLGVSLHGGNPDKRNLITNHFRDKGYVLWHWIDDFWIIQIPLSKTPKGVWDDLTLAGLGTEIILIFELPGHITYYGYADPKAWEWLKPIATAK